MERIRYFLLGVAVLMASCQADDTSPAPENTAGGLVFNLMCEDFENGTSRSGFASATDYDNIEFCVTDSDGNVLSNGTRVSRMFMARGT